MVVQHTNTQTRVSAPGLCFKRWMYMIQATTMNGNTYRRRHGILTDRRRQSKHKSEEAKVTKRSVKEAQHNLTHRQRRLVHTGMEEAKHRTTHRHRNTCHQRRHRRRVRLAMEEAKHRTTRRHQSTCHQRRHRSCLVQAQRNTIHRHPSTCRPSRRHRRRVRMAMEEAKRRTTHRHPATHHLPCCEHRSISALIYVYVIVASLLIAINKPTRFP